MDFTDHVDSFDTSKMDKNWWNDRWVHKNRAVGGGTPFAVDIKIKLVYDASATYADPWRYRLILPYAPEFSKFLKEAGYIRDGQVGYYGASAEYETPEAAEEDAILDAKRLAKKFKNYMEAQAKAKEYTLTLPLDSTDEKE